MRLSTGMILGMTQPMAPSRTDRIAAALQVYADAIRYGHLPAPDFITLHTAAMPFKTFMALADQRAAKITIVEPGDENKWQAYARIDVPFGEGILPASVQANAHATSSVGDDARRREDIATHNAECLEV